jgi:hypothetical protein
VAIEKEVAADAIGELFTATKAAFMPFVEESVTVLFELLDHYYEGIRKSVIVALFSFIRTIYELSEPQEWVQGATVVSQPQKCWMKLIISKSPSTPTSRSSSTTSFPQSSRHGRLRTTSGSLSCY